MSEGLFADGEPERDEAARYVQWRLNEICSVLCADVADLEALVNEIVATDAITVNGELLSGYDRKFIDWLTLHDAHIAQFRNVLWLICCYVAAFPAPEPDNRSE